MQKPRLFITGINGRIGTILHKGLQNAYQIFGLDRKEPFSKQVFKADISQYDQVAEVLSRIAPQEYLIHLAADPSEEASWESVLQNNIIGARNVFEAANEIRVRRIIFASSNHVTGAYEGYKPDQHLHKEFEPELISVHHPIRPDGYYGVSKVFGEALARYFCSRFGIECICLRLGSVLEDNDPRKAPRFLKTWLSHRDLIQLVEKSLNSNVMFGIYYGVSNNKGAFWDISNAKLELGYAPQDDASTV